MDRGIVELDALADADGTGAEDNHLFLSGGIAADKLGGLVFIVIGGVEIGGLGGELRGAGVHHLVDRQTGMLDFLLGQPFDHLV